MLEGGGVPMSSFWISKLVFENVPVSPVGNSQLESFFNIETCRWLLNYDIPPQQRQYKNEYEKFPQYSCWHLEYYKNNNVEQKFKPSVN